MESKLIGVEIRNLFVDFFKEKEYLYVYFLLVVFLDDFIFLFINVGMNQVRLYDLLFVFDYKRDGEYEYFIKIFFIEQIINICYLCYMIFELFLVVNIDFI